jgi:NAD(P)-dependent dehydrogenase (short-subunit alcohol dehydrogenase family)
LSDQPWQRSADSGQRLAGKVAVVTGAGSADGLVGIGVGISVLFASQGAKVGVLDVSAERAEATRKMIEDIGGECIVTVGDITDPDANARCINDVAGHFGRLDILVNSAAITGGGGNVVDVDLAAWDRAMAINLTGTVLSARHAIPHMRAAGGGSIVNISSIAALRGHGSGAYAASKGAMVALTADWAYLHGREGIRVNCIAPGHVFTPMGDQGGDDLRQRRRRAGLLGTEGVAWDIAWPAVFLASDEARWITGVVIPVDAGTISSGPLAVGLLEQRSPS